LSADIASFVVNAALNSPLCIANLLTFHQSVAKLCSGLGRCTPLAPCG
jgi:hypothetical protein